MRLDFTKENPRKITTRNSAPTLTGVGSIANGSYQHWLPQVTLVALSHGGWLGELAGGPVQGSVWLGSNNCMDGAVVGSWWHARLHKGSCYL